jgi:hypothetical protein
MMDFIQSYLSPQMFRGGNGIVTASKTQGSEHVVSGSAPEFQSESITPHSQIDVPPLVEAQDSTQVFIDRRRTERLFIYPTSDKQVKNFLAEKGLPFHEKSVAAIQKEHNDIIRKRLLEELVTQVRENTQKNEIRATLEAVLVSTNENNPQPKPPLSYIEESIFNLEN